MRQHHINSIPSSAQHSHQHPTFALKMDAWDVIALGSGGTVSGRPIAAPPAGKARAVTGKYCAIIDSDDESQVPGKASPSFNSCELILDSASNSKKRARESTGSESCVTANNSQGGYCYYCQDVGKVLQCMSPGCSNALCIEKSGAQHACAIVTSMDLDGNPFECPRCLCRAGRPIPVHNTFESPHYIHRN
jgi:hypothetical protein